MMPKTIVVDDDPELEAQLRRHAGVHGTLRRAPPTL